MAWPGQTAIALEAFATIGGIPAAKNTGNVKNVPPPATALLTPAAMPAKKSKTKIEGSGMSIRLIA